MADEGIYYSMIAGVDGSVIAEASRLKGNTPYPANAKKVLQQIPRGTSERRCIAHDHLLYNVVGDGTLVYICITDENFSRVTSFNFLNAIKNNCGGGRKRTAREMSEQMMSDIGFYSDPRNDRVTKIRTNIDEVKNVMIDNIERILDRGEHIDSLVDKTENLEFESKRFETNARELKWRLCKRRLCIGAIIFGVLFIVIFFIVLFACSKDGVNFDKCKKNK